MKNVLIITAVFPPEPVVSANLMKDLAEELALDFKVTVLCPEPSRPLGFKMPDLTQEQNYEIIRLNSFTCPESRLFGRLRENYSFGNKVIEYIKRHRKNIDFIYNAPWPLFGNNMVARLAHKHDIPYMASVQDIYPESILSKLPKHHFIEWLLKGVLMPLDKYTLRYACKIHTISPGMAKYLSDTRKVPFDKFCIIRNWQNEKDFIQYQQKHPSQPRTDSAFTFMYLGNVGFLAGIDLVIDAFNQTGLTDARLIIAGNGAAKDSLMRKVQDAEMPNIEFIDVPAGQVPRIQGMADVMLLPVKKGFASTSIPSKLPAYMFSAKPVLASVDLGSDTALSITAAHGGWVVEPENTHLLAERMKKCFDTDRAQLSALGENAFHYAIANFSRVQNCKKLVNACKDAIQRK